MNPDLKTSHDPRNVVWWPDLKIPPINLWNMPNALWFYRPDYYNKFIFKGLERNELKNENRETEHQV